MAISKTQVKGRVNQAKGSVKIAVGKVTGSRKLKVAGAVQRTVGKSQVAAAKTTAKTKAKVKSTVTKAKKVVKKATKKVAKKVAKKTRAR